MVKAGGSGVVDSATILFCFAQLPRTASQPEPPSGASSSSSLSCGGGGGGDGSRPDSAFQSE